AVAGIAFFSFDFRYQFRKTQLSNFVPFGYSMFTPMTKTNFDVSYEFFQDGNSFRTVSMQDYLNKESAKGITNVKSKSLKSQIYFEQLYQLDLAYQKYHYAKYQKAKKQNFDSIIVQDELLKTITLNLKNFAKLYQTENSFSADSVQISVKRSPMVLPYNPDYKGDYTYLAGKGIFYETKLNLKEQ